MTLEDNVLKLKRLLEEGFLIDGIAFEITKDNLTVNVTLIKGSVREKITSVNQENFFDYIRHFQRVEDGYGNFVYAFIENLEEYEERTKKLPQYKPLRDFYYVKLGERLLDKDITMILLQTPGPGVRLARAHFFVKVSSNPEFEKLDLNDQVAIYARSNNELVYRGNVNFLAFSEDAAYFECEIGPRNLRVEKVNAEFIHFRPLDALYFMTRMSGLTLQPSPEMKIDISPRDFVVIVPILDLIIKDTFSFAGVEIYPFFNSGDDHRIRKSNMSRREPDWGSNFPRARVVVKASSHFDAIKIGHSKIMDVVNWFAFRNDLMFSIIDELGEKSAVDFNNFKHYSRVRLSSMVYCREIGTDHLCLFDTRSLVGNILDVEYDLDAFFKPTRKLFEPIISKTRESMIQEEKNVILSLRWLARSIHESHNVDKLLDLWTSLEFIISKTRSEIFFDEAQKKLILDRIEGINLSQMQMEILRNKVAMLNDAPLLGKLRMFAARHKIDFVESEWRLLREMRQKRNSIIHGDREPELSNEKIEKLRSMIERILLTSVNETLKMLAQS